MKLLKVIAAFLALATLLPLLAACGADPLASTEDDLRTVLTVGGMDVPYEFYRALVLSYRDREPDATAEEIRARVTDALREVYAVFALCAEYDIDPKDSYITEQVDLQVAELMDQYESREAYAAALREVYMNDSVYRRLQQRDICSDTLYYAMERAGDLPTDAGELQEIIESDAFIRIKQILIVGEKNVTGADGSYFVPSEEHTDEEAVALLTAARERFLSGADFDALVEEYGESLYMKSNTDGYYLCRGMWDTVNEEAAFALVENEISSIVESDKGFSLFLRCEKEPDYIVAHFSDLCDDYRAARFTLALEEKSASLTVETTELYDSLDPLAME